MLAESYRQLLRLRTSSPPPTPARPPHVLQRRHQGNLEIPRHGIEPRSPQSLSAPGHPATAKPPVKPRSAHPPPRSPTASPPAPSAIAIPPPRPAPQSQAAATKPPTPKPTSRASPKAQWPWPSLSIPPADPTAINPTNKSFAATNTFFSRPYMGEGRGGGCRPKLSLSRRNVPTTRSTTLTMLPTQSYL